MTSRKLCVLLTIVTILVVLTACGKESVLPKDNRPTIDVTDMSGRTVTIPREINRIYAVGVNGSIIVYTLAPEKLSGLGVLPASGTAKYISEQYHKIPVLGDIEGNSANSETVLKANPDIIISSMMADVDKATTITNADRLQKKLDRPVVVIDGRLTNTDKTYEFLGNIMDSKERAKELGDYCAKSLKEIKVMVEKIPAEKLVRVYYAEGPKGLTTDPAGSRHTEVLDFVRGINVAQVQTGLDSVPAGVSLEQVMIWNPDVIITGKGKGHNSGGEFYNYALKEDNWENIKAVKTGQVYEIPAYPFNWFDRPPSVSRVIGIKWLANLLYPDYVTIDIKAEVKEFYAKFFDYNLNDQEMDDILQNAMRK